MNPAHCEFLLSGKVEVGALQPDDLLDVDTFEHPFSPELDQLSEHLDPSLHCALRTLRFFVPLVGQRSSCFVRRLSILVRFDCAIVRRRKVLALELFQSPGTREGSFALARAARGR